MVVFTSEEEFYSDSIEISDIENHVGDFRNKKLKRKGWVKSREGNRIETQYSEEESEVLTSHKRFRKIESSQETFTQNSDFNNLNNEIENINTRIDLINSSIESIIDSNNSDSICILERISKGDESSKIKSYICIGSNGLKIGRSPDSDFPGAGITNKKHLIRISRNHAYIYVKNENGRKVICLVDCNSANGTFVNNKRIKSHILRENDILSFGSTKNTRDRLKKGHKEEFSWIFRVIKCLI
ncbi:forkhead associated domain (FHA) containing protein [Cryptosporidium felis]|nr:forkhead associated domain (FHA) containing protein [Cryptosporidium felis]